MAKFPVDLARLVDARWSNIVSGEYNVPACPSKALLKEVFEVCFLAANTPEEGRYPRFNVVVTDAVTVAEKATDAIFYPFSSDRPVVVEEIRRLAPATDPKKSAIWVTFDARGLRISGICDLGTSWHRAKLGLTYSYRVPSALILQVERPGKMKVFQGEFAVASLFDGMLVESKIDLSLFLHKLAHDGFEKLTSNFTVPTIEEPRDFESFWFTALCNVFSAATNSVNALGHGGTIIVVSDNDADLTANVRIKYSCVSTNLKNAFISFINARNSTADYWTAIETAVVVEGSLHEAELILAAATEHLVEAIRFTAQLASCDGAIVISTDLSLVGFGAEIKSELEAGTKVLEVRDEINKKFDTCDIEQFGMRHRSAIKLASKITTSRVLVISQDGPISAVWAEDECVFVKKGVSLGNMNMPWAS